MIKYRPEIDGLRTIAVIPVILFHLGYSWIKGGYYGVDVFFVISGFLISKILIEKIEAGEFSMYKFWIRRVKRLLPILLTVVLVVLLVSSLLVFKPDVRSIAHDAIPAIFSYFNFHALLNFGDYWGSGAEKSFFLHTWSLSVEEQFYLIYPFLLFLIFKFNRSFVKPMIILIALSLVCFIYFLIKHKSIAFYMLPCRMWELSAGGLVAVLHKKLDLERSARNVLSFASLLMILLPFFIGEASIGFIVIVVVLGTAILLYVCTPEDIVGQLLSSRMFVFIGKISYSVYLWHWPIIVLKGALSYQLRNYNNDVINLCIIAITFILATLSYYFIENKTRGYRHTPKIVLAGIGAVILAVMYFNSSLFNIYYPSKYNQVKYYLKAFDVSPTPVKPKENNPLTYNVFTPARDKKYDSAYKEEGIITKVGDQSPKVIVLGDSHGVMWAKLIDEICDSLEIGRSFYTANGSDPFFDVRDVNNQKGSQYFTKQQRVEYVKSILHNVDTWHPKLCIIASKWESLTKEDKSEFENMLRWLAGEKVKVLVLNQPPALDFDNNNASQYLSYLNINPKAGSNYLPVHVDKIIENNNYLSRQQRVFNFNIYNVFGNMFKQGEAMVSSGKNVFYFDDDHLSYQGASYHKANITQLLVKFAL